MRSGQSPLAHFGRRHCPGRLPWGSTSHISGSTRDPCGRPELSHLPGGSAGRVLCSGAFAMRLRCSEGSQLSSEFRQCPPGRLGPSGCLASTLFTETLSKPAWLSILTAGAPGAVHTSWQRWASSQADLPEARARLLWVSVLHQTQMWLPASSVQQFFQGPSFMDDMVPSFWNLLVICLPAAQGSHVQDPAFESGVTVDPALIPLAGPASPTL